MTSLNKTSFVLTLVLRKSKEQKSDRSGCNDMPEDTGDLWLERWTMDPRKEDIWGSENSSCGYCFLMDSPITAWSFIMGKAQATFPGLPPSRHLRVQQPVMNTRLHPQRLHRVRSAPL
jgi:hypothetical protein